MTAVTPPANADQVIATALSRHHNDPDNGGDRCLCGGWRYHTHREGLWENHAADAVLAALHIAGYAVTPLAEVKRVQRLRRICQVYGQSDSRIIRAIHVDRILRLLDGDR